MFDLAIICGGPSQERGISLNSARSLMDHLGGTSIKVHPIYVDTKLHFYEISPSQLYSNTPLDFDFKLGEMAKKLSNEEMFSVLKSVDLVFPAIHGAFGEDGTLQELLEGMHIPFIGPSASTCKKMFFKHESARLLSENGFHTLPSITVNPLVGGSLGEIERFFLKNGIEKAIVKPTAGGSSIGIFQVFSAREAFEKAQFLVDNGLTDLALIEPYCEGKEFTTVLMQNLDGSGTALIPTEIEVDYNKDPIFSYRRKYLPESDTFYHTPPRFDLETTKFIQLQCEVIFKLFEMRDFARIDGWVLETGKIIFTDLNPISGMEQNSFLFRQAALCGMSHKQTLLNIISSACKRYNIPEPLEVVASERSKRRVYVLFGNNTAERQVSLMSGTNVWLKLRQSDLFSPIPILLEKNEVLWPLPYAFALNHTTEEVLHNCKQTNNVMGTLSTLLDTFEQKFCYSRDLPKTPICAPMLMDEFLLKAKSEDAFIFLALHGGEGEDGTLQRRLDQYGLAYNGSGPESSSICMDKLRTGMVIEELKDPLIRSLPKRLVSIRDIEIASWERLCKELESEILLIKPRNDGCSAGIIKLYSWKDLERYMWFIKTKASIIPKNTFLNQPEAIELPTNPEQDFILEPFIQTDKIVISDNTLKHTWIDGWIELTVGVLETCGQYQSLNPSITISEREVLSLEEKFQGGTGINLTPPPTEIISFDACIKIKRDIEKIARVLGIENYARIDIFFNIKTNETIVIEANSLPGLTPSTVIYHQALAEVPPLNPIAFLECIIQSKEERVISAI